MVINEPDWDEVRLAAEEATGLKVERNTFSIVVREVRRWLADPGRVVEASHALDHIDDFIARCNGDDRGSCHEVNVLRTVLATKFAEQAPGRLIDVCHQILDDGRVSLETLARLRIALEAAEYQAPTGKPPGFVKPDSDTQVFFYEQEFYVLSNFSAFSLQWSGLRFDTSEAAYHWEKFKGTDCDDIRARIRLAASAHEAFKIAEDNKPRRRPDWDDVKVDVMRGILLAKVDQHKYVREKLLETGHRELVEDSWRDDFWGWGPNRDGQNMLGKLWMEIRTELQAKEADK